MIFYPAVFGVGSSAGGSGFSGSVNRGTLFISLKPLAERDGLSTQRVIDRLTEPLPGQVRGRLQVEQSINDEQGHDSPVRVDDPSLARELQHRWEGLADGAGLDGLLRR